MTPEELKDCARRFFAEIWNARDESAIDRFIPEDAKGNDADFGSGREGFRKHGPSRQRSLRRPMQPSR